MSALSLDDFTDNEPAAEEAEEAMVFDRAWAVGLMNGALESAARAFAGDESWQVLAQFLPGSGAPPSYEAAAQQLGLSVPALKSQVHRVRQRFREELRRMVSQTVGSLNDVDDELNYLHRVLAGANS